MRISISWTQTAGALASVLPVVLIAVMLLNVFCAGSVRKAGSHKGRPTTRALPTYAHRSPEILQAYRTAVRIPNVLEEIPCFCGCMEAGHRGLKDCFIAPDGSFDDHGADCYICYEEAVDVGTWFDEGIPLEEIKTLILHKYGDRL